MSRIGVYLLHLSIILMPLFCNFCNTPTFVLSIRYKTEAQKSKCGKIIDLYRVVPI
jgi:hypothetical protein